SYSLRSYYSRFFYFFFFFFNDTATTEIYTLSLHDALPILAGVSGIERRAEKAGGHKLPPHFRRQLAGPPPIAQLVAGELFGEKRSEEHTSELQSPYDLVCRLLLEKKKKKKNKKQYHIKRKN